MDGALKGQKTDDPVSGILSIRRATIFRKLKLTLTSDYQKNPYT